jgi:fructuronate reductase
MTTDVRPWEGMKLRLLNGSHSLLAYVGGMSGRRTIVECMREPRLSALVERYLAREGGPSLTDVPESAWKDMAASIVRRFGNDSLAHKTNQIAMDGSQKIPQRWLAGTSERLRAGAACPCTALGLAGWLYHMREQDEAGVSFPMRDPQRDALLAAFGPGMEPDARVDALFARRELVPDYLGTVPGYADQVKAMLRLMLEQGALAAVEATLRQP